MKIKPPRDYRLLSRTLRLRRPETRHPALYTTRLYAILKHRFPRSLAERHTLDVKIVSICATRSKNPQRIHYGRRRRRRLKCAQGLSTLKYVIQYNNIRLPVSCGKRKKNTAYINRLLCISAITEI